MAEFQLTFPQFFQPDFTTPPPWTLKPPQCNTTLTQFSKTEINHDFIKSKFQVILDSLPNQDNFYTDASKTAEGTTAAVVTSRSVLKL